MRVRLRPTQRAPTTPATPIVPASSDPHGRPRTPDDANRAPTLNGMPAPWANRELVSAPGLPRALAGRVRRIPTRPAVPTTRPPSATMPATVTSQSTCAPGSGSIDRSTPSGNIEVRAYATSPAIGAAAMAAMPPSMARSTARSRRRQPRAAMDSRSSSLTRQGSAHHLRDDHGRREHGERGDHPQRRCLEAHGPPSAVAHDALRRGVRVATVRQLVDRVHHVATVHARGQVGGDDRLHDPDVGMRAEERTGEHHLRGAVVEVRGRLGDTDERRGERRHGRRRGGVEVGGDLVLVVGQHLEPVAHACAEALGEERRHRAVDGELVRVRRVDETTVDDAPSHGVVVAGEGVRFEHQAAVAGRHEERRHEHDRLDRLDAGQPCDLLI